ncbi:MAG: hypothetical protein M3Y51_07245 [Actinomycetota bacterium]|nr:hypothetical protein [Actinomycetota bacterium]
MNDLPDPSAADTLVGAMASLRALGYTSSFLATDDGRLSCSECSASLDPAVMEIDYTIRFEGASNPDDESILLGISCPANCDCQGVYTTGYGPSAGVRDGRVLRALAGRPLR